MIWKRIKKKILRDNFSNPLLNLTCNIFMCFLNFLNKQHAPPYEKSQNFQKVETNEMKVAHIHSFSSQVIKMGLHNGYCTVIY